MSDQTTEKQLTSEEFDALWPLPIPGINVATGKSGSGKSTFLISDGAAMERHLVLDFEKSQESFAEQLPLTYVDVQGKLVEKFPKGYKNLDMYNFVTDLVNRLPAGQYDVAALDNASVWEDAIVAYVESNPGAFGHTTQQYNMMSGIKWGDVKICYSQFLTTLKSKVKMVNISVHLRDKWINNKVMKDEFGNPVEEPKGKDTLMQLSSLFVWLEVGPGGIPSGRILKSRVDRKVYINDPLNPPTDIPQSIIDTLYGEPGLVTIPVLPLRLPQAIWPAIRNYMKHPADRQHPKPGESLDNKVMSEDDRLRIKSVIAQSNADVSATEFARQQAMNPTPQTASRMATIPAQVTKPEDQSPAPSAPVHSPAIPASDAVDTEIPPAHDITPEEIDAAVAMQKKSMVTLIQTEFPAYKLVGSSIAQWLKEGGFQAWDYTRYEDMVAIVRSNVATQIQNSN